MNYTRDNIKEAIALIKENNLLIKGSPYEIVLSIIQQMTKEYGFVQFHSDIQKIIKNLVIRKEWEYVSSKIEGNEVIWLIAIANFIENKNNN